MKTIYQLRKLYRRAVARSAASLKILRRPPTKNPNAKPWKGNIDKNGRTIVNVMFHRARLEICSIAKGAVEMDLRARRVGMAPVRDARPKKVQRADALRNVRHTTTMASMAYPTAPIGCTPPGEALQSA